MKNFNRQDGFTLVEILIAMFILVTALLGTAAVTATVINGNAFSSRMTQATTLAQEKMEELLGTGYDIMQSGSDTEQSVYDRVWSVSKDSPMEGMATIDVEVTFPWKGQDREVSISTLRSQ